MEGERRYDGQDEEEGKRSHVYYDKNTEKLLTKTAIKQWDWFLVVCGFLFAATFIGFTVQNL